MQRISFRKILHYGSGLSCCRQNSIDIAWCYIKHSIIIAMALDKTHKGVLASKDTAFFKMSVNFFCLIISLKYSVRDVTYHICVSIKEGYITYSPCYGVIIYHACCGGSVSNSYDPTIVVVQQNMVNRLWIRTFSKISPNKIY